MGCATLPSRRTDADFPGLHSKSMYQSALVVCIGNICRSPMAEGILRAHAESTGKSCRIESAGIAAVVGAPADPLAVELMQQRDIDISSHRGRQITYDILRQFDLILVMEQRHRLHIEQLTPVTKGRVFTLGHWDGFDVQDPYGHPLKAFEDALRRIDQGVISWQKYLS